MMKLLLLAVSLPLLSLSRFVPLLPDLCQGCFLNQSSGTGGGKIIIADEPLAGNGLCTGTSPNCTRLGCNISGVLKIVVAQGAGNLWVEIGSNPVGRNPVSDGWTWERSFDQPGAKMECENAQGTAGSQTLKFFTLQAGGTAVAHYTLFCTYCPSPPPSDPD